MDTRSWVQSGNIVTESCEKGRPGRYLGNGRFGSVLSVFGLNEQPERQAQYPNEGRSHFLYMDHWGRFRFVSEAMGHETTADYILPLVRLFWEREPEDVTAYRQVQDIYDGTLTTAFTHPGGEKIRVTSWFDMAEPDLAVFCIEVSEGTFPIRLAAVTDFVPYPFLYKKKTEQSVSVRQTEIGWEMTVTCPDSINSRMSTVFLKTNAAVEMCGDGLRILAGTGRTEIYLSCGGPVRCIDAYASGERSASVWHTLWGTSGKISFPDRHIQITYVRSLAYLLSSYINMGSAFQPVSGLTGNMFPFHFVQDMAYIAPALMMTGHIDIVRRWVEKFAGELEAMRGYAKRLWSKAQGIYPPWELPYGAIEGYHAPGVPVVYCYEPHNTGYLCRMAAEAALYIDDSEWTARYAAPIIRECAAFYRSFASKGPDGRWHFKWEPCVGQDEAGGRNQSDYLCSLYSAKYCFTMAFLFDVDESETYSALIRDGLAFQDLVTGRGIFRTCRGDADDFGRQKHPVQLDGVTYLPAEAEPHEVERSAYNLRHDLTVGASKHFYEGWTLGQFLLAGSNLGDAEGWRHDWEEMRVSDYTDPDWVQIYETSGQPEKSFYMATHGMILQSLLRNFVNDYWDRLDLAGCPVFTDGVEFENIRTHLGVTVSGEVRDGECAYTLYAWKNCRVFVGDSSFEMGKGDVLHNRIAVEHKD